MSEAETGEVDWAQVRTLLDQLYSAATSLEELFAGRKFTLDGHLVGSIGEVIAAYMFDLNLFRGSNKGHDATTRDGCNVEVKLTQSRSIAIRHQPDHLIVLFRNKQGPTKVIFNGPGNIAWEQAGSMQSNGQRSISLTRLCALDKQIVEIDRLPVKREAPV